MQSNLVGGLTCAKKMHYQGIWSQGSPFWLSDLSQRFVRPVCIALYRCVPRHDIPVGIGVSGNKKKREKRKGRWMKEEKERRRGNGGGGRRKKEEEEEKRHTRKAIRANIMCGGV